MRAVQITEFGGPEVLTISDVEEPKPGDGQVLIHVDRAGINYADTHQVENSYLQRATLPMIPGGEVVGRTDDGRRVVALVGGVGTPRRLSPMRLSRTTYLTRSATATRSPSCCRARRPGTYSRPRPT